LSLEPEPVYQHYLSKIEGIGPILGANVVALLYDPQRFRSVSALWHYAGYHVEEGRAPRLQKRKRVTWNPRLRVLGYKIGKSFVMCGGGYRSRYEEYKEEYRKKHPDLSRGHIDAMARRKTVKTVFSPFMAGLENSGTSSSHAALFVRERCYDRRALCRLP
jgi:hypothetical protein